MNKLDVKSPRTLILNSFRNGFFVIQKRFNSNANPSQFYENVNRSLEEIISKNQICSAFQFNNLICQNEKQAYTLFGAIKNLDSYGTPIITNFNTNKSVTCPSGEENMDIVFLENFLKKLVSHYKQLKVQESVQKLFEFKKFKPKKFSSLEKEHFYKKIEPKNSLEFRDIKRELKKDQGFSVIIEGVAGIGLSYFCQQYLNKWANSYHPKSKIQLVLYLPLKEFVVWSCGKDALSLIDLIASYVMEKINLEKDLVKLKEFKKILIEKASKNELLWIFDGWSDLEYLSIQERYSDTPKSLMEFISNALDTPLVKKRIITTRTEHRILSIPKQNSAHLFLSALNDNQYNNFLKIFFENKPEMKNKAVQHLDKFQQALELLYHPTCLQIICKKIVKNLKKNLEFDEQSLITSLVKSILKINLPSSKEREKVEELVPKFAKLSSSCRQIYVSQSEFDKFLPKEPKIVNAFIHCGLIRKIEKNNENPAWAIISLPLFNYFNRIKENELNISTSSLIISNNFVYDKLTPTATEIQKLLKELQSPLSLNKEISENILTILSLLEMRNMNKDKKVDHSQELSHITYVLKTHYSQQTTFSYDFLALCALISRVREIGESKKAKINVIFFLDLIFFNL